MATKNNGLFGHTIRTAALSTGLFSKPLPDKSSTTIAPTPIWVEPTVLETCTISNITMGIPAAPLPSLPPLPHQLAPHGLLEKIILGFFVISLWCVFALVAPKIFSAASSLRVVLRKHVGAFIPGISLVTLQRAIKFFFPQYAESLNNLTSVLAIILPDLLAPKERKYVDRAAGPDDPIPRPQSYGNPTTQTADAPPSPPLSVAGAAPSSPFGPFDPAPSSREMAVHQDAEVAVPAEPAAVSAVAPSAAPSHPVPSPGDTAVVKEEVSPPPSETDGDEMTKAARKALHMKERDRAWALAHQDEIMSQSFEGKNSKQKARLKKQRDLVEQFRRENGQ